MNSILKMLTEGNMAKKKTAQKKRGGTGVAVRMALCLACSIISAALITLLCSLITYQLPDPAKYTHIAAYASLTLSAVATGVLSAVFMRDKAYLCALAVSGCTVIIMLILAASLGGISGMAVSVYAAYTLVSLFFAWLFSRNGGRRTKRR